MRNSTIKAMLLGAMLLASTVVHAQYAWIDEKGVRHFSDQPPPTNTPASKILKVPRGATPAADAAAPAAPAPSAVTKAPAKAAPTLAEREADYQKRRAQGQEDEKKAALAKKDADNRRENCAAATREQANLASGRRVRAQQNIVMTEEEKAREQANIARVLTDCKTAS
jgi:type IV secretory pathway VirB10-like protein